MAAEIAHSPIGASSMHRWSVCPGSVRLSKGIPSKSSVYAEEGTRAHEIAAQYLIAGVWPVDADEETVEAVTVYTDMVAGHVSESDGATVLVEHRFNLEATYKGLFGTADCVIYHPSTKLLQVIDYKHGQGIPVEVKENPQLMYYALGALLSIKQPVDQVESVIVQPRCFHPDGPIRRWVYPAHELVDFALDLVEYAKKTEDPNAAIVPGDHCRFCPAAGICPKIQEKALAVAKLEFSPALSYDPEKLSETLNWLPALEAWIKQVREFAYGEADHGRMPPGFKLVEKRKTRKWRDENSAANFIKINFDRDMKDACFTEPEIKTVAQVEKVLGKKDMKEMEEFVIAESSGLTLVPNTDSRPAVNRDPKNEFTVITGESHKP